MAAPLTIFAAVVLAASSLAAQTSTVFDLPSGRAQRAIITPGPERPELAADLPEMGRALAGAFADLSGRYLSALRMSVPPSPMVGDAQDGQQLYIVHLESPGESKKVAIYEKDDAYVAVELDHATTPHGRAQLKREVFAAQQALWHQYRGGYSVERVAEPRGQVFELAQPYISGRFLMDKETAGTRLFGGSPASSGTDRRLDASKFHVRLPQGYDPRDPAGLLVWVNAGHQGQPPPIFDKALDELNIIAIGADSSGNNRALVSRVQLALDAAATAAHRFHIDPRRVYISGISGGGRVSSIAQICFPEVFAGAVPIVGMSSYKHVPNGMGQYFRAEFSKPRSGVFKLMSSRRIAALTGRHDGNLLSITGAAEIFERDGIPVRVWEDPKLGHEMPKAEDLHEALRWVDEPYRKLREQEDRAATRALELYVSRFGSRPPADGVERTMLLRVLEEGPWTKDAWKAWELFQAQPKEPEPAH